MKPFNKYLVKIFLYNILLAVLMFLPLIFIGDTDSSLGWLFIILVVAGLSLLIQFIVGLVYAAGTTKKEFGKAMLLCVGIFLLIGLGVCGSMFIGL